MRLQLHGWRVLSGLDTRWQLCIIDLELPSIFWNQLFHRIRNVDSILENTIPQKLIWLLNTLRPRQNGRRFTDDVFKCILLNESVWILLKNSLKFVPKVPINNIPALVQILAWRRSGDKPLSEPMMVSLLTHICVTRPQWVNSPNVVKNLPETPFQQYLWVWKNAEFSCPLEDILYTSNLHVGYAQHFHKYEKYCHYATCKPSVQLLEYAIVWLAVTGIATHVWELRLLWLARII